jgi:hypothetical protein
MRGLVWWDLAPTEAVIAWDQGFLWWHLASVVVMVLVRHVVSGACSVESGHSRGDHPMVPGACLVVSSISRGYFVEPGARLVVSGISRNYLEVAARYHRRPLIPRDRRTKLTLDTAKYWLVGWRGGASVCECECVGGGGVCVGGGGGWGCWVRLLASWPV